MIFSSSRSSVISKHRYLRIFPKNFNDTKKDILKCKKEKNILENQLVYFPLNNIKIESGPKANSANFTFIAPFITLNMI